MHNIHIVYNSKQKETPELIGGSIFYNAVGLELEEHQGEKVRGASPITEPPALNGAAGYAEIVTEFLLTPARSL